MKGLKLIKATEIATGMLSGRRVYRVVQQLYEGVYFLMVIEAPVKDALGHDAWQPAPGAWIAEIAHDLAQQVFSLSAEKERLLAKGKAR